MLARQKEETRIKKEKNETKRRSNIKKIKSSK